MTQLRNADLSIAARNLLSPKRTASRAVMARHARTEAVRPPQRLHQFFERRCDANPIALALICGDERLSYGALDARANRLARYLVRGGVRPGDRVGLLIERSVHTYVALLAVLKCGACFVPIDACSPAERIAFIAEDAGLELLLTTSGLSASAGSVGCRVLNLDSAAAATARQPAGRSSFAWRKDDICYIMYTSGTTGRPKGVAVNHSSVCNFLSVCAPIYGVTAHDRVYQGMTIAFDFSIEEIWPTFMAGATLVAGPNDHRRFGPGLAEFLSEHSVTVMCCVPTLLATVDRDVASLRTLLVGGEACPADLVKRWSRPGRRMLNTYGPTETTVTATWCELLPGRAVTIGRPLPTYSAHILDEALCPVADGQSGEICIGGPGVAVGYVNRPELTADRFVADRFAAGRSDARLYRTGDLGRLTPQGEIEYLGRIDSQVKIRGYRIELSEIEAVLSESGEVESALVSLRPGSGTPQGAVQELVAYVTLDGARANPSDLKARLHAFMRARLPCYMVPAYIEILESLPILPSGKADRSKLPAPISQRLGGQPSLGAAPATELERELARAFSEVFGRGEISVDADFFYDLGGHSLFAAQVVSRLRQTPAMRHLGIADLYSHPTVRGLALHIGQHVTPPTEPARAAAPTGSSGRLPRRYSNRRVLTCGAVQSLLLYLVFLLFGAPLGLGLSAKGLTAISAIAFVVAGLGLIGLVLPIAAKWLLIGRFRAGRYPLWGWYYCRWWLVGKLMAMAPLDYLSGSPLMPWYARLLGARIGAGCHLGSPHLHLPDLIEIGDGASVGYGANIVPYSIEDGWLHLAPVRIGAGSFVGTSAVVMLGSQIGQGSRLMEQSLCAEGQVIPDGETWAGSPSARVAADPLLDEMAAVHAHEQTRRGWSPRLWAGFIVGLLALELLSAILFVPGLLLIYVFAARGLALGLAMAPLAGLTYVLTACGLVAAGKRIVMPTSRSGIFPLNSGFGVRKWLSDKLMSTSLGATNSLYGTLYALPWLRRLGAKIGPWAEVSTVSHVDPDLLVLGAESFVADLAVIGAARHFQGSIALGTTEAGARSFIGNAALVPSGTRLPDGSLIGVQSVPPTGPIEPGSSWLGSPAIFLPRRQICEKFDESVTFHPRRRLVLCRLAIEFLRVVLPSTLVYAVGLLATVFALRLAAVASATLLVLAMPLIYAATALLLTLIVVALKWATVGRYRPRVVPLWSHFVWRTELITGLYESVAVPWLFYWLSGTPLMAPALRLFGARIGRRVYLETSYLTEFDLVEVGDDAAIGDETSLQTHLFEDRVMKMSFVKVGPGCTVGPRSVVLYDSNLAEGSVLDALSLAMKGESLPPESRWRGIPAGPVD